MNETKIQESTVEPSDKPFKPNKLLSKLIRQDYPYMWSNWIWDNDVQVGAVGYISKDSLTFKPVQGKFITNNSDDINETDENVRWAFASALVNSYNYCGEAEFEAGKMQVNWEFGEYKDAISNFNICRTKALVNVAEIMANNESWLKNMAQQCDFSHYEDGKFKEGFCVVTKVLYARGGVQAVADDYDTTLSIDGSIGGVQGMLEGGALEASFENIEYGSDVAVRFWTPGKTNVDANANDSMIPVAFEVASVTTGPNGEMIVMERWTHEHKYYEFQMRNVFDSIGWFTAETEVTQYHKDGQVKVSNIETCKYPESVMMPEDVISFTVRTEMPKGFDYTPGVLFERTFSTQYDLPYGGVSVKVSYNTDIESDDPKKKVEGIWISNLDTSIPMHAEKRRRVNPEYWARNYHQVLRGILGYDSSWSNWALTPNIEVGAIGYMQRQSATFVRFEGESLNIDDKIFERENISPFYGRSESVEQWKLDLGIPDVIGWGWECDEEKSYVSRFNIRKEQELSDVTDVLESNKSELQAIAERNNCVDENGMLESFGIITKVWYAIGGFNLATHASDTTFKLQGSTKGMDGMIGVGGSASFDSFEADAEITLHTFPLNAGEEGGAQNYIPVMFEMATFKDGKLTKRWIDHTKFKED